MPLRPLLMVIIALGLSVRILMLCSLFSKIFDGYAQLQGTINAFSLAC